MSKVPVLPPSGFRDFLPNETAERQELIRLISDCYQSHGFQTIGLPYFENLSTLQGKGGGQDNEKLLFKILKRGDELVRAQEKGEPLADMGLRFDLTLPLARYCARFREQLPKPFKVFQIQPVWRADRPQKGRYREFFQCDVDIIGAKEIGAELDCLTAILSVFAKLGLADTELHLNDRRLLSALRGDFAESDWAEALILLDKLDKIGEEGVKKECVEKWGKIPAGLAKVFSGREFSHFTDLAAEPVQELERLLTLLQVSLPNTKVIFNPTLVRGQDYYTGTIFEVRHPSLAGSLAGGGRYNRLLEIFGGQETPAFGGSIGFERLLLILQEKGRSVETSTPQVFFPLFAEDLRGEVQKLAGSLRTAGVRVDVYPDAAKLKNQFKYADDRKIPFTAILGSEEKAKQIIKWKNMDARSEVEVSYQDLNEFVQRIKSECRS
jgi:histidyl-tRNA synthetase